MVTYILSYIHFLMFSLTFLRHYFLICTFGYATPFQSVFRIYTVKFPLTHFGSLTPSYPHLFACATRAGRLAEFSEQTAQEESERKT